MAFDRRRPGTETARPATAVFAAVQIWRLGLFCQLVVFIGLLLVVVVQLHAPPALAQTGAVPEITSLGPFTIDEGGTAVAAFTASDSDTPVSRLKWSKTGGADSATFTLTSDGVLSFEAAKDYENPDDANRDGSYEVTVQVTDGDYSASADLVISLVNVIELMPTISGQASVSFAENSATRVATFTASSEADRDGVEWALSGTDAAHFSIDSPAGALRFGIYPVAPEIFAGPPDFEDPADANTDNVYSITLLALAGTATTSSLSVDVTVTDVDELGAITLSSLKPRLGTELTANLTDPDGVMDGTTIWQWERNNGREGWEEIDRATSASYTPTAADGDRYLRATAAYTDSFGANKIAEATAPHVVIALRLSSLTVTGLTGVTGDDRAFYPAFDPDTLHYAARCKHFVALTLTTENAGARLSVNGVQRQTGEAFIVSGLGRESDIQINLTDATGASTTYKVHCMDRKEFPKLTTVKEAGATEDLMMFKAKWPRSSWGWRSSLIMMDNNGVPRLRKRINDNVQAYFRVFPDETDPYARYGFMKQGSSFNRDGVELVVLDKYFNMVNDDIHILSPYNSTDGHDELILPNGDYVLLAYSSHKRDLRFLKTSFPDLRNNDGNPLGTNEAVRDSVIQVRTADGTVKFNWSSWDHMAIEDCISGSTFNNEYAHINSLGLVDGDIIAGFRHCSKILRIDLDTGNVVWRTGPSILSREMWEAGETLQPNRGSAPLEFVNDPRGGFSGQHGGHMTIDGNLLVYDNATHCGVPPGIPGDAKGLTQCNTRMRAVEYAIDTPSDELVFLSEFQMPDTDPPATHGGFAGHAEPMDNGDWMISWSNTIRSAPMPNTAMHVDPETGTAKLIFTLQNITGSGGVNKPDHTRVSIVSPVALAPRLEPLKAKLPASENTSIFQSGSAESPQVLVVFNRPVVDFGVSTPSVSVQGANIASVSAHIVVVEAPNAYLFTLTPEGDGPITFSLVGNQLCASGGVCTADGTMLTVVPAPLMIGPPITVGFGQANYTVLEGGTVEVSVSLSAAHQGVRSVRIPVVVASGTTASSDEFSKPQRVTFSAGERTKTFTFSATQDSVDDDYEFVQLGFGTLPDGVSAGATSETRVGITDDDQDTPATGAPTISGAAQVGQELRADASGIADEDGLTNPEFSYQWLRNDGIADTEIEGATEATYTLVADDEGKTIKVKVSFTDNAGNTETRTSGPTNPVAAKEPDAPGHLNVSPNDENALDLYWEAPTSDGGSPITGYRVQWKEATRSWDTAAGVSQATVSGTTYTITGLTGGLEYTVRVMASNEVGDGPASAEKTAVPRETGAPEMVRPRVDGATLRMVYDEALDEGSAPPADAFDVRVACRCDDTKWQDEEARRVVDAVSVNGDTVVLTLASAVTAEDSVVVSYTPPSDEASPRVQDVAGNAAAAIRPTQVFNDTEEAKETAEDPPNNPATGAPAISGTAQVGEALTADTSGIADANGLDNAIFSYQWIAGGSDIAGATGSSYTLTTSEEGQAILVRVSFTDDADNEETLTSAATATVAPRPPLTVSLVFPVASHHGASNVFAFDIRFSEEFPLSYETLKFHAFSVTGGEVLKAQRMDKPSNIPWRITVRPDSNGDVTVVLPATVDCDDQGAICTEDGRKLSNSLNFTVSGPGK